MRSIADALAILPFARLQVAGGGARSTPRPRPAARDAAFDDLLRASGWLTGVPDPLDALEGVRNGDPRRPRGVRGSLR